MKENILLIDDVPVLRSALIARLIREGFGVEIAENAARGLEKATSLPFGVIVLDITLPDRSGLELCCQVRQAGIATPILVLSGRRQTTDKVVALKLGADDYVTKPFSVNELLARVRANLRRVAATPEAQPEPIADGDFYIDPEARLVRVGGKDVHLTPKEFDLLLFMARHPNKVLTHRVLLNAVWGGESVQQPEYLRVFINQLRKKIEVDPSDPRYLLTDAYVGYRFAESPETGEPAQPREPSSSS